MTKLTIILLFSILFSSLLPAQDTLFSEFKMLTWNIQMLPNDLGIFSKHLRKKQSKRVFWISDFCKAQQYDLIAFQEVFDKGIQRKLKKLLAKEYPYQIDPINQAGRLTNNGILIVSKTPIKYIDHITFEKGVHEDRFAAKGCTLAEVELGEIKYQLAATHLQAGGSEGAVYHRGLQFQDIRTLIDRNIDPSIPLFILGDMNTRKSDSKNYLEMLSLLEANEIIINDSRPFTIDGENYWNDSGKAVQLDYILVQKRNQEIDIINCTVSRPQQNHKGELIDLADHYGIEATIHIRY